MSYERVVYPRCEKCGVNYPPDLEDSSTRCPCRRAHASALVELLLMDPSSSKTLANFDELRASKTMRKARKIGEKIVAGERLRGITMASTPGTGKTHLMIALFRKAIREHERMACMYNAAGFVRKIQGTYARDYTGPNKDQIIESVAKHEVVFFDDLGKERISEDVDLMLYELVDALYAKRRTLMVATNLKANELKSRYDDATISRLLHMTTIVDVSGSDNRNEVPYG